MQRSAFYETHKTDSCCYERIDTADRMRTSRCVISICCFNNYNRRCTAYRCRTGIHSPCAGICSPVNTYPEPYMPPAPAVTTQTAVTTAAPPKTTTAAPVPADLTPKQLMNKMTLEQKVCQMFMVTPEALTGISPMVEVGQETANAMKKYPRRRNNLLRTESQFAKPDNRDDKQHPEFLISCLRYGCLYRH